MLRLHLVVKTTPSVDVRKGGATMNWRRFVCAFAASAATFACVGDVSAATHEAGRLIDPSIEYAQRTLEQEIVALGIDAGDAEHVADG